MHMHVHDVLRARVLRVHESMSTIPLTSCLTIITIITRNDVDVVACCVRRVLRVRMTHQCVVDVCECERISNSVADM